MGPLGPWGGIGMAAKGLGRDWNGPLGPPRAPRGCFFQPRLLGPAAFLAGAFFSAPRGCFFQPRLLGTAAFLAGAFFFAPRGVFGANTWPRWGKPRIQIPEIELLGRIHGPDGANPEYKSRKSNFWAFLGQKWSKKKLSLRGWDLSGEIRAGIWRRTPPRMCKTVGWRPDW